VLPDLRIDPPRLEPDPVLLEQLSQLSSASAARGATGHTARSLLSAATVLVVAGLSWLTGTLPGVASPFDRHPTHQPTHQQAPLEPSGEQQLPLEDLVPPGPAIVPPGQVKPHQDNGNHFGQTKPHQDNGNHTGQTKPHQDNGNHTGQTKPHQDNGNHTGQTKPHQNNGNHTGQTKPHDDNGNQGVGLLHERVTVRVRPPGWRLWS
jgi:hypothetical protein